MGSTSQYGDVQYRLKCDVHVFPPQLYLTVSHHTLNRPFLLHIFFMFATHVLYNFYMFFPIFSTFSLYMFFTHLFYTFLNCFQHIVFMFYTLFYLISSTLLLTELCSPSCTLTPRTWADSFFRDGVLPLVSCRNRL